jgi:hypothetical protein
MSEEHRLTVYSKLAADVLGAVAEGTLPLSGADSAESSGARQQQLGTTELLLSEVLMMLSTPPLRMASKRAVAAGPISLAIAGDDDDDLAGVDGGEGGVHASVAAAKSRLIHRLLKRQISEQVLPVVLGLRQVLLAAHSTVVGPLVGYIKTLMEDHGEEIRGA